MPFTVTRGDAADKLEKARIMAFESMFEERHDSTVVLSRV